MLALKQQEILRRAASLRKEVADWVTLTSTLGGEDVTARQRYYNAHHSQVQAVEGVVNALLKTQQTLEAGLDAAGATDKFLADCFGITQRVIAAQTFWDFYRDKFEQRFSARFADALWVADTAAWDCYTSVIKEAEAKKIVPAGGLREPPLTYLSSGFSPLTWVRTSLPHKNNMPEMGTWQRKLPFAIIEVPYEEMENLWELMALHHEVGHDLEQDLGIHADLQAALEQVLEKKGVPPERRAVWAAWQKEILADLVGLQLGGGAFAVALASLLLLPRNAVLTYNSQDPHPTHYVRIRLCAAYLRGLLPAGTRGGKRAVGLADALETQWVALYGDGAGTPFAPLLAEFDAVAQALMDTPLPALKNNTLRSLMPYTEEDDDAIHGQAAFWNGTSGGMPPTKSLSPRHLISAARLAAHGAGANPALLAELNKKTLSKMLANAPEGLRAGEPGAKQRWAALADDLLAAPVTLHKTLL